MKNKKITLSLLFLSWAFFSGTGIHAEETVSGKKNATLAVVDGRPIAAGTLQEEMKRRPGVTTEENKQELLDFLVRNELLFAAAKREGYEKNPEVVRALKQIMIGKYLNDTLEKKQAEVKADDKELDAYYQSHRDKFGTPAMIHAALIRIAVPAKASPERQAELLARAEAARREALALDAGVPGFGSVAVNYSEDQDSRYRGGDIGWLAAGTIDNRWDRKVSEAVFARTTAEPVSPVIIAQDGYYIVKRMESKEAAIKPYNELKDAVRYHVIQEKKRKIEQDFIAQLRKQIPVTVNTGLLKAIPVPAPQTQKAPATPAR